jgi:hypothetical protein
VLRGLPIWLKTLVLNGIANRIQKPSLSHFLKNFARCHCLLFFYIIGSNPSKFLRCIPVRTSFLVRKLIYSSLAIPVVEPRCCPGWQSLPYALQSVLLPVKTLTRKHLILMLLLFCSCFVYEEGSYGWRLDPTVLPYDSYESVRLLSFLQTICNYLHFWITVRNLHAISNNCR